MTGKQAFCVFALALSMAAASAVQAADSLVVQAARKGDVAALRAAVRQKTDVNVPAADGATALHWACHHDDRAAVELLIKAGANVNAVNGYGVTPLSLAAENGSAAVIDLLLGAGADANASMPGGETALMTAARAANASAIKRLLARGADVNAREQTRGQTALMWAASGGNVSAIQALVEGGADIHARSHGPAAAKDEPNVSHRYGHQLSRRGRVDSFTPLLFAVYGGQQGAAKALLDLGANVNDTVEDGTSALVLAIFNAHFELAAYLLDRGADPNAAKQGWNALHQVARSRGLSLGLHPHPVPTGNLSSLELAKRLIARGADINAPVTVRIMKDGYRAFLNTAGMTPFLLASKAADVAMMRLLAANGADLTATNVRSSTPLMMTAGIEMYFPDEDSGTTEDAEKAVQLALELGAGDINATNDALDTALHGAALRESPLMVEMLVAQGARLDARNGAGMTPVDVCNRSRNGPATATAKLLRTLMADRGMTTPTLEELLAESFEKRGSVTRSLTGGVSPAPAAADPQTKPGQTAAPPK